MIVILKLDSSSTSTALKLDLHPEHIRLLADMLNAAVPVFGTYDGCWHESDHKVVPTLTLVPDRAVVPRKVETFKTDEQCWAEEKTAFHGGDVISTLPDLFDHLPKA